jgi:cell division protein FtsL
MYINHVGFMRVEVLMAVKMLIMAFWIVTSHSLTAYQFLGETYHLHLQISKETGLEVNIDKTKYMGIA